MGMVKRLQKFVVPQLYMRQTERTQRYACLALTYGLGDPPYYYGPIIGETLLSCKLYISFP